MCLKGQYFKTIFAPMAVVVAQLVEWSIPKWSGFESSHQHFKEHWGTVHCIPRKCENTENGNGP